VGAPSSSWALKCSLFSVHTGTITHVLAISSQHVSLLAAVDYIELRAFALPAPVRICATLALIWLYVLVAGAPPSAIRAGVVATLVLAARLFGRRISPV
jgi:competence protein ComEC